MRALAFKLSIAVYLLGRSLGRFSDGPVFGPAAGLRLIELAPCDLPGPDWVRLAVIASGICGTDISILTSEASPALEPFASFPALLGHEILARVVEVGPAVSRVVPGQRVAVDPLISCTVRGYSEAERCPSCASGKPATCARGTDEGRLVIGDKLLGPGLTIGYHRDLPGGFSEEMVAHQSQLHPVDEGLSDKEAVLIEPLSVALHAVLAARPDPERAVLVIGSGPIALSTVWAVSALGHRGPLLVQVKRPREAALARELGASQAVEPGQPARAALLATGATARRPMVGPEVYGGGGFSTVFDCVGSRESLDQALRFGAAGGRVILLGCAGMIRHIDLTPLWQRELEVRGFVGYGRERFEEQSLHTFEVTQELLRRRPGPVAELCTSSYPLERYREALVAARNRRRSGALKVLLTPR